MGDDDRRLRPGWGCAAAAAARAGRVRLNPHPGLIRSGSLTPGIDPAAFGLPAGTALRFERPAAELRALIPAYAVLDADPAIWTGPDDWVLPGRAQMWIILADGPVTARMRRRAPVQLGQAVVFGPTSNPVPFAGSGGVSIAVELSPAGWARLRG